MDTKTNQKNGVKQSIIMACLAIAILSVTFGLEYKAHQYESSVVNAIAQFDVPTTQIDIHRIIRPDTSTDFEVTGSGDVATVALKQGKIWMNTLNSAYDTTVTVGAYSVQVPPAIVSIEYSNGTTTLEVLRRYAQVTIGSRMLFVPQNTGVELHDTTLKTYAKELAQILPSKFFKQFSLYTLTTSSSWYADNQKRDEKFADDIQSLLAAQIRERGPRVSSTNSSIVESISSIKNALALTITFDSEKRNERAFDNARRYLDTALYNLQLGNTDAAQTMLTAFTDAVKDESAVLQKPLRALLDELSVNEFGDTYAKAKDAVAGVIAKNSLKKLLDSFSSVYDVLARAESPEQHELLIAAANQLASQIEKNVAGFTEDESIHIAQLGTDLLGRSSVLLREAYFRAFALVQDAAISKAQTRETKTDTQQFFIAQKLDQLQLIKKKLDAGELEFQQARKAMIFVAQTIEVVKPLLSQSAFLPYFEEKYKEIEPFISFLRSSSTETLHGSFESFYAEYKEKIRDANYVQALLNDATGGDALSTVEREELASRAGTDLAVTALSNIQLAFDNNPDSSVVIISKATFDGLIFSARYDTVRKIFSDIVFDGKPISNGIRLENLRTYLLVSQGKTELAGNASLDSLVEAPANDIGTKTRATIDALKKLLADSGITLDEKYVDATNYEKGSIRILLASRDKEPTQKLFSFIISSDLATVHDLEVQTVMGQIPVNDEFSIKELAFRVDQVFERAVFEKSKEGEVNKLMDKGSKQ